jgi:hypothetical protein
MDLKLYLCTVAPLLYILYDILPPPPLPNVQYIVYRHCVSVGGGWGVLKCTVDHILQEFYTVFDQIQNLQNCFTTPNKMTSKDWGL